MPGPIGDAQLAPRKHIASLATNSDLAHPLTFWVCDLHVGLRMELSSILIAHGHRVIMGGNSNSGPWRAWKTFLPWLAKSPQLSLVPHALRSKMVEGRLTTTAGPMPPEGSIIDHFDLLKSSSLMKNIDAFICALPLSQCELYLPFNKTIIWLAAHRFTYGRCSRAQWERLTHRLQKSAVGAGGAWHVVAATSTYDVEYLRYFTGLAPKLIELTGHGYLPRLPPWMHRVHPPQVLVFHRQSKCFTLSVCAPWLVTPQEEAASGLQFRGMGRIYKNLSSTQVERLRALSNHRAVVLLPVAPVGVRTHPTHTPQTCSRCFLNPSSHQTKFTWYVGRLALSHS